MSLFLFIYFFYRFLLCWTILQLRVRWTSSSSTTRQTVSPSTSTDKAAYNAPEGEGAAAPPVGRTMWRWLPLLSPKFVYVVDLYPCIYRYLYQWNYLNQSVIIRSWKMFIHPERWFFFPLSFSLCSFPAFCWANQTLVWLKPELHPPGDCSNFSFSIQQATTWLLCSSSTQRPQWTVSWLWPFTFLGLGVELGLGTLQIFLQAIWTGSKLAKSDKCSKWDTTHNFANFTHFCCTAMTSSLIKG